MSTREHQKRLINRLRGSLIASSVVGALGIAGYLGISVPTATASDSTGTSTDSSSDSSSYFGDSTGISSGSGTSHAATSGS